MSVRILGRHIGVVAVAALVASEAAAYIHFPPPTMPKMCKQSTNIRVLIVKKHDRERGIIVFEVAETLKGTNPKGMAFRHSVRTAGVSGTKPILDWVADGKRAVMFTIEGGAIFCGYVFIDRFCYSVDYNRSGEYWALIRVDPEMAACFHGTVEQLRQVTKDLLAGKDVQVPVDESRKVLTNEERGKHVPALNEILQRNRAGKE